MTKTNSNITQEVILAAQSGQHKYDVPASISIAQWALESGWGAHHMGSANNYFGMKFAKRHKNFVERPTKEFINQQWVTVMAKFAAFENMSEAFEDHAFLIASSSKYKHVMEAKDNADEFANRLEGVYATDPQYTEKLQKIMRDYNLYQYNKLE